MTRRIQTADGSFAGIVYGSIRLAHFRALFDRLRFDDGIALNVFHRDGTLLIRAPARPQLLGQSIRASPAHAFYQAHARGEFQGRSALDGVDRVYSFANLDDLPLIVTVATDVDSIREVWIYKAAIVGILILSLCVLTFGLTVLLHREVGRRAAAEASTREANAALAVLARTDGLTGLPNRRSYDEHFAVEWTRAARLRTPLALMIVDADHFKQFNDRFGHQRGDEVLKAVALCLQQTLDTGGLSFRIGGEEFVALLPGLDATAAGAAAEAHPPRGGEPRDPPCSGRRRQRHGQHRRGLRRSGQRGSARWPLHGGGRGPLCRQEGRPQSGAAAPPRRTPTCPRWRA